MSGQDTSTSAWQSDPQAWTAFDLPGNWYKGNLHCHSTQSDGVWSPEDVVAYYQKQGYSFLALSDHRRVTDVSSTASETWLPLLAMEIDGTDPLTSGPYHMQAIGLHNLRRQPPGIALPALLEAITADGGLSIFNHPYWLGTCATDLKTLPGCLGVEVYNAGCEVEIGKGYSTQFWDDALQRGQRFFGFATDDAHCQIHDYGLGWIMAKAPRLDEASLMVALRQGHFYSSTGPELFDVRRDNGTISVSCSPVNAIHFIGETRHGLRVVNPSGKPLTQARYSITGKERYLRVECIAADGTRAWSNPLWLT